MARNENLLKNEILTMQKEDIGVYNRYNYT